MQANFHVRLFVLWLIGLGISYPAFAQMEEKGSSIRVGLGFTGYTYRGDLTLDDPSFWRVYPGANISLQFSPFRKFQPQVNAGFGRVLEQWDSSLPIDPAQVGANDFFSTNFFYLDFRLAYLPFRHWRLQPYVIAGGGLIFFNPLDQNGNFLIDNVFTREQGELFNTTTFALPIGTGLRFHVNKLAYVGLEYLYRSSVSDYVDNIGLRGQKEGPDQLHNLMVSLNFTLRGKPVEVEEVTPAVEEAPPVVAIQEDKPSSESSGVPDKLSVVPIPDEEAERKRKLKVMAHVEWGHVPPLVKPYTLDRGDQVHYQVGPGILSPAEQAYYHHLAKLAIEKSWTQAQVLLTSHSLSELAYQYHTTYPVLVQLNPNLTDLLDEGTSVILPDLARAAAYDEQQSTQSGK